MRFPISWLQEFFSTTLSSEDLAKKLTMIGIEVDKVESKGEGLAPSIVVGLVLSTEKHPSADRLTVAKVSDGKEEFQIVCGAPNCRPGIKTAFAKIGTVFEDEQGSFTIKKSKLRGIESFGMLCSEKELGISEESDKIMELPLDFLEGKPLKEIYKEVFFEISLTPNLTHAGSVMGVARELAAACGGTLLMPSINLKEEGNPIEDSLIVDVIDREACPRYTCRVIKNVKVGPSPDWLKQRLEDSGLRSINNVVDITNYLLLEFGHPLHAFNYDRIEGEKQKREKKFKL